MISHRKVRPQIKISVIWMIWHIKDWPIFVSSVKTLSMPDLITSVNNPRIKNILQLQSKSRERRSRNLIVIEGFREISRAVASGVCITEVYYCGEFEKDNAIEGLQGSLQDTELYEISRNVFEKLAYREGSDGLIVLARPEFLKPDDLKLKKNPLIIVLEAVEKPGNLGAVMRTADAAGVDAVVVCDPLTDLYNPNVIRSSVGCIFTVPVVAASGSDIRSWLSRNKIRSYAAALTETAVSYESVDYIGPTAIILGTEATGLSVDWLNFCDRQIIIPMHGIADSLNVSTSAAIIIFEAIRQRKLFKGVRPDTEF